MTITASDLDIPALLRAGRAAALAGDRFAARARFREATELAPDCAEAWLGLSSAVPVLAEKREYLQRALALAPDSDQILASLRYVEQLQAEGLRLEPSLRASERASISVAAPAVPPAAEAPAAPAVEFCSRHAERETALHCIQCNRPICGGCARMTPVGQLCPECRRGRRPAQYKVAPGHLLAGALVALLISGVAASILQFASLGFFSFYIAFFIGPVIAELLVRVSDKLTRAKRGLAMQIAVVAGVLVGMLPFACFNILALWGASIADLPILFQPDPMMFVYLGIVVATAVARLR